MSGAVIRQARPEDAELLTQWRMEVLRDVFPGCGEELSEQLRRENRAYYEAALRDGSHAACFAYLGGEIVGCGGMCLYREMPSPDNPGGGCAYLMNIYTRPRFRGSGVGLKTVSWLIRMARERGAGKIYLEATDTGRPLYRSLGFCDMDGYMKLCDK